VVTAPNGGAFDLFEGDVLAAPPAIYQKFLEVLNH